MLKPKAKLQYHLSKANNISRAARIQMTLWSTFLWQKDKKKSWKRLLNFGLPFFLKLTHLRCSSLARSPYYERQWLSTVLFYSTFGIGMMMGKVLLAEFEMTAAKLDSTRESLQNDPDGTYALGKLQCSRISALPSLHHCFCATASFGLALFSSYRLKSLVWLLRLWTISTWLMCIVWYFLPHFRGLPLNNKCFHV